MTISGEGRKDGSESHLLQPQLLGFGGDSPFKKNSGVVQAGVILVNGHVSFLQSVSSLRGSFLRYQT